MKSLLKYENSFKKVKEVYILVYITYVLLARIVPFVGFITADVNSIIYSVLAIAGVLVLAFDFFASFSAVKSKENLLLLLFLLVCVISSVCSIKYGVVNNVKTLIWTTIQFFVLFSIVNVKSECEIDGTMRKLMKVSSAIWLVATMVSVLQFFLNISYIAPFSGYARRQGFVDARLFGVFTDPNFAAVTSVMVVLFCWLLLKDCNKKAGRVYYITNIVIQLIYVVLSGSRTAMYGGVILAFVIGTLVVRNKELENASRGFAVKSLAGGVAAALLSVGVILLVKYTLPLMVEFGDTMLSLIQTEEVAGEGKTGIEENEKKPEMQSLDRPDVSDENISNNRYEIWSNYVEASTGHRIVGLSPRNLLPYLEDNFPDCFAARKGYDGTHNGWLAVFVCTGILGTAVMTAFFGVYIYHGCRYLKSRKHKSIRTEVLVLLGCVFILALSAALQPEIFFVNTYGAVTFWLFMGYLLYYMKNETV